VDPRDQPFAALVVQRRPGLEPMVAGGVRRVHHQLVFGGGSVRFVEQVPGRAVELLGENQVRFF